ncbi:hypothetical protein R80B4_02504 [Fibrobacteres bacterium R8-0-B4]
MKIFIAGPRAISKLDDAVKNRLYRIYERGYTVLVGDANGVDKAVQQYFLDNRYPNVVVYASNGKTRNNLGNWQVESVSVPPNVRGFEFYAAKDSAMADCADYGFMIWNGKSKGTLNNIINLLNENKKVVVFFDPQKSFFNIGNIENLEELLRKCGDDTKNTYAEVYQQEVAPTFV